MNKSSKGFTLIELMIVIGIASLIAYRVSISSSGYFKKLAVDNSSSDLMVLTQLARANSMNTIEGKAWGVCLSLSRLYLFADSCNETGKRSSFAISNLTSISGLSTEIKFDKLTGNLNSSKSIVISSGSYSKTININNVGGIDLVIN